VDSAGAKPLLNLPDHVNLRSMFKLRKACPVISTAGLQTKNSAERPMHFLAGLHPRICEANRKGKVNFLVGAVAHQMILQPHQLSASSPRANAFSRSSAR